MSESYLSIRNWAKYQNADLLRKSGPNGPPWCKYYARTIDDHRFMQLPLPTRAIFLLLLAYSLRVANAIPSEIKLVANIVHEDDHELCREAIEQLLKGRWLRETRSPRRSRQLSRQPSRKSSRQVSRTEEERESRSAPSESAPTLSENKPILNGEARGENPQLVIDDDCMHCLQRRPLRKVGIVAMSESGEQLTAVQWLCDDCRAEAVLA